MGEFQQTLASTMVETSKPSDIARQIYKDGGFNTQTEKILKLLQTYEFIPTDWLASISKQYNARLLELRKGKYDTIKYVIVSKRLDGVFGFVYEGVY